MITKETLRKAGYKESTQPVEADCEFCKLIQDENEAKKYFIRFYGWDSGFDAECCFSRKGEHFRVKYLATGHSLEEVEDFFAEIFCSMKCDYYG